MQRTIARGFRFRIFLPKASLALLLLMLSGLLVLPACDRGPDAAQHKHGKGNHGGAEKKGEAGEEGTPGDVSEAIPVRVAPIRKEPMSSLYTTSATLRAEKQATVTARTRGVVESLLLEEGARVKKNQVLARLEDEEQKINRARALTTYETAEQDFERISRLHQEKLVSDQEYETSKRQRDDAKYGLDLATLELERTVIRAPFEGTLLIRHVDPGATVSDGTAIYDLADLDPLYADITVPERHVARLAAGQSVRLTTDATRQMVPASIERIAPAVDPATGTVKVTVAVEEEAVLRSGAFVRVEVVTDTHPDALVIERSALVAEGHRWHVFRLEPGGDTVKELEATLGFEENGKVEIQGLVNTEEILKPGDMLVVAGAPALSEGAKVKVSQEDEPSAKAEEDGAADKKKAAVAQGDKG